eukprot:762048-Hanusia_phi.AAC.1
MQVPINTAFRNNITKLKPEVANMGYPLQQALSAASDAQVRSASSLNVADDLTKKLTSVREDMARRFAEMKQKVLGEQLGWNIQRTLISFLADFNSSMLMSQSRQDQALAKISMSNVSQGARQSYAPIDEVWDKLTDLNASETQDGFLSVINSTWKQYRDWEEYLDNTRLEQLESTFRLEFIRKELEDIEDASNSTKHNNRNRLRAVQESLNHIQLNHLLQRISVRNDRNDLNIEDLVGEIIDSDGSKALNGTLLMHVFKSEASHTCRGTSESHHRAKVMLKYFGVRLSDSSSGACPVNHSRARPAGPPVTHAGRRQCGPAGPPPGCRGLWPLSLGGS